MNCRFFCEQEVLWRFDGIHDQTNLLKVEIMKTLVSQTAIDNTFTRQKNTMVMQTLKSYLMMIIVP